MVFSACSTTPQKVAIEVPKPAIQVLPPPAPIVTNQVDVIVTSEGLVILTAEEYEDLENNLAAIYRWLREAQFQLEHYRGEITDNGRTNLRGPSEGGS